MKLDRYIAGQLRKRREQLHMTQEELGRRVQEYTGKVWSRQVVSLAELGHRAFSVEDVFILAAVLGTTPDELTVPPPGMTLDLPGGQFTLPEPGASTELDAKKFARDLATLAYGAQRLEGAMGDLAGGLGALAKAAALVQELQEGKE